MTKIYITRHGETLWNIEKRWQGWKDSSLSEKGTEEAEKLSKYIMNIDLDFIYSSPLNRAYNTAKIINNNKQLPIILDNRLKEIGLGEWEGKTIEEIKEYDSENYNYYTTKPSLYNKKVGESFFDVEKRIDQFFNDVIIKNKDKNTLIVTHGIIVMVILNYVAKKNIDNLINLPAIKNCSISTIKYENESYKIIQENNIEFLK